MPLQTTTLQLPVWTPRGPGEAPRDPTLGRLPLAVSSQGEGAVAAGGHGHGFKATAPVSCSLPLMSSFTSCVPGPGWSTGPGLPITWRDPTMAAVTMAFLWALVSNTGRVESRDGR